MSSSELTPLQQALADLDEKSKDCPYCYDDLACSFHAEKYVSAMVDFDGDDLE